MLPIISKRITFPTEKKKHFNVIIINVGIIFISEFFHALIFILFYGLNPHMLEIKMTNNALMSFKT